jgi:hypothetical protein
MTSSNEILNSEIKTETRKNHLLNDHSFKRLLKVQREVAEITGWMPSLSTLVNGLVNTDNLILLKADILYEFEANKKTNTENMENSGKIESTTESV